MRYVVSVTNARPIKDVADQLRSMGVSVERVLAPVSQINCSWDHPDLLKFVQQILGVANVTEDLIITPEGS